MYEKHRDERETFEFDFVNRLVAGETLSVPEVRVSRRTMGVFEDKTAEFITSSAIISGTKVQFTLIAAAQGSHQAAPCDYVVYCKATTSQGRILVGTAFLNVRAEAVTGMT
jgi:hypothetical protein